MGLEIVDGRNFDKDLLTDNYAFRIDIPYWVFIVAGLAALLLALGTVTYHAFTASNKNPVDAHRYE